MKTVDRFAPPVDKAWLHQSNHVDDRRQDYKVNQHLAFETWSCIRALQDAAGSRPSWPLCRSKCWA